MRNEEPYKQQESLQDFVLYIQVGDKIITPDELQDKKKDEED